MNKLETLKKEAREKFERVNTYAEASGDATFPERLDTLITHVYQQAIEDAKGAIRKEELVGAITRTNTDSDETTEALPEIRSAYNAALEHAVQALEALTKDV